MIKRHINDTLRWGESEDPMGKLPVMVMLIKCLKDRKGHNIYQSSLAEIERMLAMHTESYPRLAPDFRHPSLLTLSNIAEIQCLLCQTVEGITQQHESNEGVLKALRSFLKTVEAQGNRQLGYYIVRHILAISGQSYAKDLINTPKGFFIPHDVQSALVSYSVPDVLSMFGGEQYEVVTSCIESIIEHSETNEELVIAIQHFVQACAGDESLMIHTIFTRVTRTFSSDVPVPQDLCARLTDKLTAQQDITDLSKKLLHLLLDRHGLPAEMDVRQSKGVNLSMLVIHLLTTLCKCSPGHDLYPLAEIILYPEQSAGHYIPTMPDNPVETVINYHREQIATGKLEKNLLNNLEPFSCSCGYQYVIGNCARPVDYGDKCPRCGSRIGGVGYDKLAPGNKKLTEEDIKSQTGHILGHPVRRADHVEEVRQFDALSLALLRCITHISMFTSMLINPGGLARMINPRLSCPDDVAQFQESHIQIDLKRISECCAESIDNCILLVHSVINQLKNGNERSDGNCCLTTSMERKVWEENFSTKYTKPVINEMVECLKNLKSKLATNTKKDLQTILSTEIEPINRENFVSSAGLWSYTRPLTLTSLQEKLNSVEGYPILKALVAKNDALVAVRALPDILQLINTISRKFHSQLTRNQANEMQIKRFIADNISAFNQTRERLERMITHYVNSWNIAVMDPTSQIDGVPLSEDPCVSAFLIDKHIKPRSPVIQLISFIVDAHNCMVSAVDQDRSSISLAEVTPSLLVSLANRDEIFSLISAHSEHTHGELTEVQYNWDEAEHEAEIKFVGTRKKIVFKTADLPTYTFQEDFNLWSQMQILSETQESLPDKLRDSTERAVYHMSIQNLTTSLKDLSIVINCLSAIPKYDPDSSLSEFLKSTVTSSPQHLRDEVKVKHVSHVWMILKFAQAAAFMENNQKPFDDIDATYSSPLPLRGDAVINDVCTYSSPRTKLLLEFLFAFIILRLNKEATEKNPVSRAMWMNTALQEFIMIEEEENYEEIINKLPTLPELFAVEHAASIWCAVWKRYSTYVAV